MKKYKKWIFTCSAKYVTILLIRIVTFLQSQNKGECFMKNRALKILSYLLTLCMICTCVPMSAFAVPAAVTLSDSAYETVQENVSAELQADAPQIKNIIYLIPDGAGYGSLDFSNDVKMAGGFDDTKFLYKTPTYDSPMTLFDYHAGSMVTLNVYNSMTDSAGAGTALSTGYKTINNYLGLDRRKIKI